MAPVSNGRKNMAPENVSVQGPDAPLAHRRPGYSLSGCTPAEPDSASPGIVNSILAKDETQRTGHSLSPTDRNILFFSQIEMSPSGSPSAGVACAASASVGSLSGPL